MSEKAYEVAHIDDLDRFPVDDEELLWRPVRRKLGITAFGANAYTAEKGDERVVEEHYERDGAEELYFVASGRATFTLGDEEIDAPAGTFVYAEPGTKRGARRQPSRRPRSSRSAPSRACHTRSRAGRRSSSPSGICATGTRTRAARRWPRRSPQHPDAWQGHFNAACFESLTGNRDATFEHLRRAIELDPAGRRVRAEGHGLRRLPRRPGVPGMSGTVKLSDLAIRSARARGGRWSARTSGSARSASTRTSPTRPATDVVGEHDELGEGSGEHEELYFVAQRSRDVHGQRRRDRRARGHVRLRARPSREAQAVAKEAGNNGRRRRREAGRGIHAVRRGSGHAPALAYFGDGGVRQGGRELEGLLAESPKTPGVLYNLACAESLSGKSSRHSGTCARAVELDSELP